jgi:hypothetical protein
MSGSGTAGQQAAAFASATAPATAAGSAGAGSGSEHHGSRPGAAHRTGTSGLPGTGLGGRSANAGGSSGSSPVSSVLSAFFGSSSSGGLGTWLPVLLIVILVGGCAVGLRHRYRRTQS